MIEKKVSNQKSENKARDDKGWEASEANVVRWLAFGGAALGTAFVSSKLISRAKGEDRSKEKELKERKEVLDRQRKNLEAEKEALDAELSAKRKERNAVLQELRREADRANALQNAFLREFGLVERMGEIQKCLSTEKYTGTANMDVIYTQLTNIERIIGELNQAAPSEQGEGNPIELGAETPILGWRAMETSGEYLEQLLAHQHDPAQLERALGDYSTAQEVVAESMKKINETLGNHAADLKKLEASRDAEQARKAHWEEKLEALQPLLPEPVADMDEAAQKAAARRLAEFARDNFLDRL